MSISGAYSGPLLYEVQTSETQIVQPAHMEHSAKEALRDATILRERAEAYARPIETDESDISAETDVLLFKLGIDSYAIPCGDIEEIVPLQNLISIPHTPRGIIGISSNRGVLFAVLDPKQHLQIPGTNITTMHRVVILRHKEHSVGILVDTVIGMAGIDMRVLLKLPTYLDAAKKRYLVGLTPDRIFLLNVKGLIEHPALNGSD